MKIDMKRPEIFITFSIVGLILVIAVIIVIALSVAPQEDPNISASIATDRVGDVYVACSNSPSINKFRPDGKMIGDVTSADKNRESGQRFIAVDGKGSIYVSSVSTDRSVSKDGEDNYGSGVDLDRIVSKYDANGKLLTKFKYSNSSKSAFLDLWGINSRGTSNLYVGLEDYQKPAILVFNREGKLIADTELKWNKASSDPEHEASYSSDRHMAIAPNGHVYVLGQFGGETHVREFDPTARLISEATHGDDSWLQYGNMEGMAFQDDRTLLILKDSRLWSVDITTGKSTDLNIPLFGSPSSMAVALNGMMYVASICYDSEDQSNWVRIQKIDQNRRVVGYWDVNRKK